jgi:putative oxidoreductase
MKLLKWLTSGLSVHQSLLNAGLFLLRVISGISMAFAHGINKIPPSAGFIEVTGKLGFPAPIFFAWSAGIAEFFGGILLALGFFTRPNALFLSFTMSVAFFIRHAGDPFARKEKALLFLIIFLFFLMTGSSRPSLDEVIRSKWGKNQE